MKNFAWKKSWQKLARQLPYIPRTLSLISAVSGKLMFFWLFFTLILGLLPGLSVYLAKPIVDQISFIVKKNINLNEAFNLILPEIALLAGIMILIELIRSINKWIRLYQGELVQDRIKEMIHQKAVSLEPAFFESAEYYDKLFRARIDSISKPVALLENIGNLLQNLILLVLIFLILFFYYWWIPLILLLGIIPTFFLMIANTIRFHQWRVKRTILERQTRYYDFVLCERETSAEIRLFGLGKYFQKLFVTTRSILRNEYVSLGKKQMFGEIGGIFFSFLFFAGIMFFMLSQVLQGIITLGTMMMFYAAFNQGQKAVTTLASNITETYRNIVFIENLFDFLDLKTESRSEITAEEKEFNIFGNITFQNVSFAYPFSERKALENFNLEIAAGKVTAVVGTNGAGKSTLIKLLCRFFDPDNGEITVADTNLKEYLPEKIQQKVTVLFQDFVRFNMSVESNIQLGNIGEGEINNLAVENAAERAGAKETIEKLPNTYKTMLGRWFSGSELSGGEWQKIALARAFLREAELIILDEPTSAMDSWAEAEWFQNFRELAKNKTALIITHRFTTAMQSDQIYVMDQGRVIEKGTHQELLALNGAYASSWKKQMKEDDKL